jgi:hypothetical protein
LTETSEAEACAGVVEDIAVLARRLAETEPFRSVSGPEALRALATHLDEMIASDRAENQPGIIRVAVRKTKAR